MVGSWLDYAAGIWIRGNGRCNYRVSPIQTTGGNHTLNGLGEGTVPTCDSCIRKLLPDVAVKVTGSDSWMKAQ